MADLAYLKRMEREFADHGKLIEAGWLGLRIMLEKEGPLSAIQISEMRTAFMAGAHHLFASITSILDPGEEPTDDDLRRMDLINNELKKFEAELRLRAARTEGRS